MKTIGYDEHVGVILLLFDLLEIKPVRVCHQRDLNWFDEVKAWHTSKRLCAH